MDSQVQNEPTMQYGHMPLTERRDTNLDSNGSTPFQPHQSLGQALGTHLAGPVGPGPSYSRPGDNYRISPSPSPIHHQNVGTTHPGSSNAPLTFSVPTGQTSPAMKRKHTDAVLAAQVVKRRREGGEEAGDAFDADGGAQGAKHWTDEEKSKLFNWLMGQAQDDHWNSLRATKNSCLRECAIEVFGSKKTYQALKGCYERNFNLFKQIYAFESFHAHSGSGAMAALNETDRLREYERRLQAARKAGCDVGNITARTIDHWHRMGWYELFYRRWHGDPATTRPAVSRGSGLGTSNSVGGEDPDGDDDQPLEFADPISISPGNGISGLSHDRSHSVNFINPQNLGVPPLPHSPTTASGSVSGTADQPLVSVTLTQGMMSTYMQFLQVQTQMSKLKVDYLRRREEREERESTQRRELERLRMEREAAEFEHNKQSANVKQKADRAIELLGNPIVDASVKQVAGDYLKKLFTAD